MVDSIQVRYAMYWTNGGMQIVLYAALVESAGFSPSASASISGLSISSHIVPL